MAPRDLIYLVLSNLRRMKIRVAMTAIGVVIGTAAVIVLISLASGLQESATQDLGGIGDLTEITVYSPGGLPVSGQPGRTVELDDQTLDELRELEGVAAVTPRYSLFGSSELNLNRMIGHASIVGIEPQAVSKLGFEMASGNDRLGRWQAIAGANVGEQLFDPRTGRQPEEIDLQGQSLQLALMKVADDGESVERTVRLRVTGVLEEQGDQDDYTLYLSLDDVLELNGWVTGQRPNPNRDGYDQVMVKAESADDVQMIENEIRERGLYSYSARSMLQQLNVFFLVIQGIFGGIGAIALIVAAFGIANTMTMAIYERTQEIGLMKAIGATNRDVMAVFLAEAGAIGMLGGIGGVVTGVGLGKAIDFIAGTYLTNQAIQQGGNASDIAITLINTPAWLPIFAILFSALVGIVSGLYPALRAASLSPVTALKTE